MIQIKRSIDDQYYVVVTGRNGEILSQSETLKRKSSAHKNILAQAKNFDRNVIFYEVIDTTVTPWRVIAFREGKKVSSKKYNP